MVSSESLTEASGPGKTEQGEKWSQVCKTRRERERETERREKRERERERERELV